MGSTTLIRPNLSKFIFRNLLTEDKLFWSCWKSGYVIFSTAKCYLVFFWRVTEPLTFKSLKEASPFLLSWRGSAGVGVAAGGYHLLGLLSTSARPPVERTVRIMQAPNDWNPDLYKRGRIRKKCQNTGMTRHTYTPIPSTVVRIPVV